MSSSSRETHTSIASFERKNLFWLGQNTNHLPMHPRVRQALLDSIEVRGVSRLCAAGWLACADRRDSRRSAAAERHDVGPHHRWRRRGLGDRVSHLMRAGNEFRNHRSGLEMADAICPRQAGAEVREIPIYDAAQAELSADRQRSSPTPSMAKTRIIYLVDPNNPLGICYTPDEIRDFCEVATKVRRLRFARLHLSRFCRS